MSDEPIRAREKCYPPVWLILNFDIFARYSKDSQKLSLPTTDSNKKDAKPALLIKPDSNYHLLGTRAIVVALC